MIRTVTPEIEGTFGGKTRVRVCGVFRQSGSLLLVNHRGLRDGDWWAPPGGGIEFGLSADEALVKEFLEETGLQVRVGRFLFVCEYNHPPLHAIELFFEVAREGGELATGRDPEMAPEHQIIREVRIVSMDEIRQMPRASLHGAFGCCDDPENLENLTGFLKI